MKSFMIDVANVGWIAASGVLAGVVWRSFSIGKRIGEIQANQTIMIAELKYLRERFDKHIDNQE